MVLDNPEICLRNMFYANVPQFNIVYLIIIIILVLLSAFFSSAETAFSSVNVVKLEVLAENRKKGAKTALKICNKFNTTLSTLLVGNNIVNILITIFSVKFISLLISNASLVDIISTASTTLVVLTFGEILPKAVAKKYALGVALKYAMIIDVLNFVLKPITIFFYLLQKAFDTENSERTVDEDEFTHIVDSMGEDGTLDTEEVEMINSVLDLNDKTVEDIMVPRVDMVTISTFDDIEKIKDIFFENQYSRIPVYVDDKDHIIGILHERDLFTKLIKKEKINIKNMVRPVTFVSKSMRVDSLIEQFKTKKVHMAIVTGEYGETSGLVTLEDALEELVGEIYDEHDESNEILFIEKEPNLYEIDASMEINELFERLNLGNPPEDEKYLKISSFIYENTEDVPEEGLVVTYKTDYIQKDEENDRYVDYSKMLYFTVSKVEDRRIINVSLKIADLTNEDEDSL